MAVVGFIGLGIMGRGMLNNLVTKLDPTTSYIIWNRTIECCTSFSAKHSQRQIYIAESASEVIRKSDITISMLSTEEASVAVFDDELHGVLGAVSHGKIIVDCATLSPERMMHLANVVSAKGGLFLEAPVSGSKAPAEQGQLIFLCGGDEDLYKQVTPMLDAMGKAKFLFGPVGQGSRMKLVVNMIMGSMMAGFSEGLCLAKGLELDLTALLQVLDLGAMSNPMFRSKGPLMINGDFAPAFPLKHAQKDMRLALEQASANNISLPVASAANSCFVGALSDAGDDDFSAVFKAISKDQKH